MVGTFATDQETSKRMASVRQRGTKPELQVRRLLHSMGIRYRTSNRDLAGSPDIANRKRKWALFVHGCFWHHHAGCKLATVPKRNRDRWLDKFRLNVIRDQRVASALVERGFTVVSIFECELKKADSLKRRLTSEIPASS